MITHADDAGDGTDHAPDDLLTVILRPPSGHLSPPPGHYEAVRRGAARRRLLRTAIGAGVTCAIATLVVLPLRPAGPGEPAAPTVPMAPPPASSPSAAPTSVPTFRAPADPDTARSGTVGPTGTRHGGTVPTSTPDPGRWRSSVTPAPSASPSTPSASPSTPTAAPSTRPTEPSGAPSEAGTRR
ncbi:hypothetical protein ACFYO5_32040 [Streptomyces sp. NPDC006259]|uniref:hypothetical protein n=1 Tax=Streptomyces sp. NPDC006259 TaxID=3364740 RepID=UPI0036A77B86